MAMSEPNRIDIITQHPDTGQITLIMTEHRRWLSEQADEMRQQFLSKLNAYLSYALDGELQRAYPGAKLQETVISLQHAYPLDDFMTNVFFNTPPAIKEQHGITLIHVLGASPFDEAATVTTALQTVVYSAAPSIQAPVQQQKPSKLQSWRKRFGL